MRTLEEIYDIIGDPKITEFIKHVFENERRSKKAQKLAIGATNHMIDYLIARKMYNTMIKNHQVDVAIAGCLLHNVFMKDRNPKNWLKVFTLRDKYYAYAESICDNPQDIGAFLYIFQIVEAQLGEEMPVVACRPVNGQITYIVWEIIWLYYYEKSLMRRKKPETKNVKANKPAKKQKDKTANSIKLAAKALKGERVK